jgi:hypothetical protein
MKSKDKKCKECGETFAPKNSIQKVCSVSCAMKFAQKSESKKEDREWKVKKKKMLEENKTLSDYQRELQKEINTIVRLIDRGHECISSKLPIKGIGNAGHLFSVGSNPTIRFHLHNIWLQSVHDNLYKSGNFEGFRKRLIEKFGESYFEYLESLKSLPVLRLSKDDLVQAKTICKQIQKELATEGFLDDVERLEIRSKLNQRIGIYKQ